MEMMDVAAAVRWLNDSCDRIVELRNGLESTSNGSSNPRLEEMMVARRGEIENTVKDLSRASTAIGEIMTAQRPLLLARGADHAALTAALRRHDSEIEKTTNTLKETKIVSDGRNDGWEGIFAIDVAEAKALRNLKHRINFLFAKGFAPKEGGGSLSAVEIEEESQLKRAYSAQVESLHCPPGYGEPEKKRDSDRLSQLSSKRMSPPSCGGGDLKGAEDEEEAVLTYRVAAFGNSPEGRERKRLRQLIFHCVTPDEQSELDQLQAKYSTDPNTPVSRAIRAFELQHGMK